MTKFELTDKNDYNLVGTIINFNQKTLFENFDQGKARRVKKIITSV